MIGLAVAVYILILFGDFPGHSKESSSEWLVDGLEKMATEGWGAGGEGALGKIEG